MLFRSRLKSAPDVKKSLREIAVKSIGMPGFSMAGGLPPGLEHVRPADHIHPTTRRRRDGNRDIEARTALNPAANAVRGYDPCGNS